MTIYFFRIRELAMFILINNFYTYMLFSFVLITATAGVESKELFSVNYHEAMASSRNYTIQYAQNDLDWQRVISLYDKILNPSEPHGELRIPKKIHQIWLGSPLPEKCKKLQATWKKHNPDWEYYLWTEKEIEALGLVNKSKYDAATNYGEKSDIARYEILYQFGGLYIDTDFECLKSFDPVHYACDFYAGVGYDKEFVVFNGLIGSRAGHPILENCIKTLFISSSNSPCIMRRTGPFFFTERIKEYIHSYTDQTVLFPLSYLYPCPYIENISRAEIEHWFKPESFAVHHWHRSWCQ